MNWPRQDGFLAAMVTLADEFGEQEVERAAIFLSKPLDKNGKHIAFFPTPEQIRAVLEVIHGRVGVNKVRVTGRRAE